VKATGALAGLCVLAASSGCSTSSAPADPVPCSAGFLGDASSPIDFDILAVSPGYTTVSQMDGGTISLMQPLQGGRVLFVGARVTNVDACGLTLTGALRDETTQQVRFDTRTINLIPTGDGWGATGVLDASVAGLISNFSNVPVCPNEWSTTDVDGHSYGLEVTVEDRNGRMLLKKMRVTPVCGEPANAADCVCICRAGYVLGSNCPALADGGDGGGDAGAGGDSGPGEGGDEGTTPVFVTQ